MVGNCPHSSPTLSTSVTNILMAAQNLISQIAYASFRNSTEIAFSNDIISFLCGQLFVKIVQFLDKCGQFPICLATWRSNHRGMSYQMSVLKDLSEEEMICEMADEREGGGGKKEDLRGSIIAAAS